MIILGKFVLYPQNMIFLVLFPLSSRHLALRLLLYGLLHIPHFLLFSFLSNPRVADRIERVRDGGGCRERDPPPRDGVASPGPETEQKAGETFATATGAVGQSQHTSAG